MKADLFEGVVRDTVTLVAIQGLNCPLWARRPLFGSTREFIDRGAPAALALDLEQWAIDRKLRGRTGESDSMADGLLERLSAEFPQYRFIFDPDGITQSRLQGSRPGRETTRRRFGWFAERPLGPTEVVPDGDATKTPSADVGDQRYRRHERQPRVRKLSGTIRMVTEFGWDGLPLADDVGMLPDAVSVAASLLGLDDDELTAELIRWAEVFDTYEYWDDVDGYLEWGRRLCRRLQEAVAPGIQVEFGA